MTGNVYLDVMITVVTSMISSGLLSVWLTNRSNKKLADEQKKHEKELTSLKAKLDSGTYVSNLQYEREYALLQNIWKCYIELSLKIENYGNELNNVNNKENFDVLAKEFKNYRKFLMTTYIFIDFDVSAEFIDLLEENFNYIKMIKSSGIEILRIQKEKIDAKEVEVGKRIYDYVNSLKIN